MLTHHLLNQGQNHRSHAPDCLHTFWHCLHLGAKTTYVGFLCAATCSRRRRMNLQHLHLINGADAILRSLVVYRYRSSSI
jgi:hypothetical protein